MYLHHQILNYQQMSSINVHTCVVKCYILCNEYELRYVISILHIGYIYSATFYVLLFIYQYFKHWWILPALIYQFPSNKFHSYDVVIMMLAGSVQPDDSPRNPAGIFPHSPAENTRGKKCRQVSKENLIPAEGWWAGHSGKRTETEGV